MYSPKSLPSSALTQAASAGGTGNLVWREDTALSVSETNT